MNISVDRKPLRCLYNTPLLHQTYFWSQVKENQGFEAQAYELKVRAQGQLSAFYSDDMLILLHPISRDSQIAYVPYGPALTPQSGLEGEFLEELSETVRPMLPESCIMLRYDLPWKSPWEEEETPEVQLQEIRINYGTENHSIRKAPSDMLPTSTMIVDLRNSEEDILMSMKPKTRYNIRLAMRKGVQVHTGSYEDLDTFYRLYTDTCTRNGLNLHKQMFFESMYRTNYEDPNTGFELLIATLDGIPLSAMFLTFSSKRATYLYGASSSHGRDSMSTYALQWEAMRQAKKAGCTQYDLFGVAPSSDAVNHPMAGLYRFKQGFGGSMIHRMGCWDFYLKEDLAMQLASSEAADGGYHLN